MTAPRLAAATLLLVVLTATQVRTQNLPACFTRPVTASCPDPDLQFHLYSGGSSSRQLMNVSDLSWLNGSLFDPLRPTVMLVHGNGGGEKTPMVTLLKAYIKLGSHNVIMVDWGAFAQESCYVRTVSNVPVVSKCIGHMLKYLEEGGVVTENITCVGHDIGAHVCGVLANYAPQRLNRIVALDPARPLVQYRGDEGRLDPKDAKMVQVIHTNTGFYGLPGVQGTVDFCVNGGAQPSCRKAANPQLCSHLQSICYFAESLFPGHTRQGVPCQNLCPRPLYNTTLEGDHVTMGADLEDGASGMYCVTAMDAPYCLNPDLDPEYGDSTCCSST